MENRFGIRDLITVLLLLGVLVSIWFAMVQYDRQWTQLEQIKTTVGEQAQDIKQLRHMLTQGVSVSSVRPNVGDGPRKPGAVGEDDPSDPFARLRAAQAADDYAPGDWLIDVFGVAVGKLTPLVSADIYQRAVEQFVLEALADRDPKTLEWRPRLARSWTVSEDGLRITFALRDDATFSDGQPLDADDVLFTYNWIMNPKVATPRSRAYFEPVESVEKLGPHAVRFTLREPYFKGFETCAGLAVMAEHFYSRYSEEQFNEMPGLLFGSGPYRLPMAPEDWQPGTGTITLVRNERYWGVAPAFDRIVFREISEATARLVSFRNGETDIFRPQPEQYAKLKDDAQLRGKAEFFEYESLVGGYRYIAWNQRRDGKPTAFADTRVRRALTMLTDRQRMTEELMVGLATVTTGPFHRLGQQADPNVEPWPYDPQAARDLLKQAGFEDRDGDGVIESADGTPLRFKLIYPSGNVNYQQMAFFLKDAYARAGVIVEPDPLEWTIMIQRIGQRDFDAMTLGWSGTIEGDPYQIFHSGQIEGDGDNYISYRSPRLDKAIETARYTVDEATRMKHWHEVHRILHEDQPYTFLWTSKAVQFVDNRIHNVKPMKLGLNSEVEWYVPLAEQRWQE